MGVAVALALFAPVAAAQQTSQAKPDPKPEQKVESKDSLDGKWNMLIDGPQGQMNTVLEIKQEGKKIGGSLTSDMGGAPIEGEFAEGKLTFWMTMDAGGQQLQIGFTASVKPDGTLAGTLDFGQGAFPWTAARAK
jgi:hypothetical protein